MKVYRIRWRLNGRWAPESRWLRFPTRQEAEDTARATIRELAAADCVMTYEIDETEETTT